MKKTLLIIALLTVSSTVFADTPLTCVNNICTLSGSLGTNALSNDVYLVKCPNSTSTVDPILGIGSLLKNTSTVGSPILSQAIYKSYNFAMASSAVGTSGTTVRLSSKQGLYTVAVGHTSTGANSYEVSFYCRLSEGSVTPLLVSDVVQLKNQ